MARMSGTSRRSNTQSTRMSLEMTSRLAFFSRLAELNKREMDSGNCKSQSVGIQDTPYATRGLAYRNVEGEPRRVANDVTTYSMTRKSVYKCLVMALLVVFEFVEPLILFLAELVKRES